MSTSPTQNPGWSCIQPSPLWRRLLIAITLLLFAGAVVAIWLRNRDILRDLYDYSSVIAAAGKIEAGLRPYTDFRSTMQSATYAVNWGVEQLFGANYLALTWGGLLVSLGGGAALVWMWRRSFGWFGAALLGGTIAVSGLAQHVVVFYNPIGLLCFAIVTIGLAQNPRLWPVRSLDAVLVALALVLGGTNKINFQALTVATAALLIGRSWLMRETSARATLASWGLLGLLGIVIPLALELAWTGATLREWIDNVLLLPAERVGLVTELLRRDIIFQPAYDLYHHLIFKRLAAAGLVLLTGTAAAAAFALHGTAAQRRAQLWLLAALPLLAVGGILLTVTNVETPALTTLSLLVGATAIWAALAGAMPERLRRRGALVLPLVGLLWAVVGGYAAWEGSRVMFSTTEPNRDSFVRLVDPPPALAYLRDVRLDADLYASLQLTAIELERLRTERGNLSTVLFGPMMEWMERAYPESILGGMPVWYHQGTALRSSDGPWLIERLASHKIDRIVLNPSWESWPENFRDYLDRNFNPIALGPTLRLYKAREAAQSATDLRPSLAQMRPLTFCRRTRSNIHVNTTTLPRGMDYCVSSWGVFLGRSRSSSWTWNNGVNDMSGTFIAVLKNREGPPVQINWRISDASDDRTIQSGSAVLSATQPEARTTFNVSSPVASLRLEVDIPSSEKDRVFAGWRELWIKHAGNSSPRPPPMAVSSSENGLSEITGSALFIRHSTSGAIENGWYPAPFEAWRQCGAVCSPWTVRVNTQRRHDVSGSPTIVSLVWYKAGRIEILREKLVSPDEEEEVALAGWMPEPDGWMGVFARAADIAQPPNCRVQIVSWNP